MSVRRAAGFGCFAAGALLLAWMAFEYFFLAFLAGKLLPEAGVSGWIAGFARALFSFPGGTGLLLLAAGFFLINREEMERRNK